MLVTLEVSRPLRLSEVRLVHSWNMLRMLVTLEVSSFVRSADAMSHPVNINQQLPSTAAPSWMSTALIWLSYRRHGVKAVNAGSLS